MDGPTARQGTQAGDQAPPTGTGAGTVGHARRDTELIVVATQNWDHTAVFSRGGNEEYLTFWYVCRYPMMRWVVYTFRWGWGSYLPAFDEALEKMTVEADPHASRFGNSLEGVKDDPLNRPRRTEQLSTA